MLDFIIEFNDDTKIKSRGWRANTLPMKELLLEVHKTFENVKAIRIERYLPI